jgi:hypothetical protein
MKMIEGLVLEDSLVSSNSSSSDREKKSKLCATTSLFIHRNDLNAPLSFFRAIRF